MKIVKYWWNNYWSFYRFFINPLILEVQQTQRINTMKIIICWKSVVKSKVFKVTGEGHRFLLFHELVSPTYDAASSSDCYLCAKLHLPSKILDFLMARSSSYSDAIAGYYHILPIVTAQRMFVKWVNEGLEWIKIRINSAPLGKHLLISNRVQVIPQGNYTSPFRIIYLKLQFIKYSLNAWHCGDSFIHT